MDCLNQLFLLCLLVNPILDNAKMVLANSWEEMYLEVGYHLVEQAWDADVGVLGLRLSRWYCRQHRRTRGGGVAGRVLLT